MYVRVRICEETAYLPRVHLLNYAYYLPIGILWRVLRRPRRATFGYPGLYL